MKHGIESIAGRMVAVPVGVVLATVVLAGCGHSTTHAAAPATSPASSPAATTAAAAAASTSPSTPVSPAAPRVSAPAYKPLTAAQLAALLPAGTALPGWKATSAHDAATDKAGVKQDAELAACVGSINTDPLQVAEASTPTYSLTTTAEVQAISATANSYKTVAAVTSDVAAIKNPRYQSCFNQELKAHGASLFGHGLSYVSSTVVVTPGKTPIVAGELDAVLHLKNAAGKPVTLGLTAVQLTRPGVEETLTFLAQGKPVPVTVARAFVTQASTDLARGTSTVST